MGAAGMIGLGAGLFSKRFEKLLRGIFGITGMLFDAFGFPLFSPPGDAPGGSGPSPSSAMRLMYSSSILA